MKRLAHTLLILAIAAAMIGVSFAQPAANQPTVGQRVGNGIDSLIAEGEALSNSALAWLKDTKAKGQAELDRRINDAMAKAPAPFVGIKRYGTTTKDKATAWRSMSEVPDPLPKRLVLLVNGLDEPGGIWDDAAPALLAAGHNVAAFEYPNDQAIGASARLLGDWLGRLKAGGVERVCIVAHSMGGLLTRDVLTSKELYAGEGAGTATLPAVPRVVLVGTPNKGSPLAHVEWLGEARESIVRWANSDTKDWTVLLGAFKDGRGQAADDLLPESDYLKELNARPMPRNVAFTVIVGVISGSADSKLGSLLDSKLAKELLSDSESRQSKVGLAELAKGLGDGVVSEKSQTLEGVADVVRVVGSHRTMLKTLDVEKGVREAVGAQQKSPPAIEIIVERLKAER